MMRIVSVFLFLLMISQVCVADIFDPADDTINGAVLLPTPNGTEQTHGPHDMSSTDLEDWFQVLLTGGETYTVFTTSTAVTVGKIVDQNGNTVAGGMTFDSDNSISRPFRETFVLEDSGIYFIQITSLDPNAGIRYTLHTINSSAADAPTDRFDPGDDAAFAPNALSAPAQQLQSTELHYLSTTDDQDWYSVTLQADTVYEFITTGNYELSGDLFTNNGNRRIATGSPSDDGLNFRLLYLVEETGLYFLRIQSNPTGWNVSYNLHYRISSETIEPGDVWDPEDDIIDGATVLIPTLSEQTHGSHSLTPYDQYDWFCFELTAGFVYRFASDEGSNTTVDFIAPDGETIIIPSANVIGEDFFSIDYVPVENGSYYLRVQTSGVEYALYTLTYSTTQALPQTLPDQWDPGDDDFSGATNLAVPSGELVAHGPHTLTNDDRGDWYRFTLAQGRTYEFSTQSVDDTFGHLFDSDGATQLLSDDDGGVSFNFLIRFTAPSNGIYYLLVRMADSGATGGYNVTHREVVLPDEDGDQWDSFDDTADGGTELSISTLGLTHGPHAIGGSDPADWFHFVLIKDWTYEFRGTGEADTVGELYAANGTTLLLSDDDSGDGLNFRLLYTPTSTAEYTLRIYERLNRSGEYSLQYRGFASDDEPSEPGDGVLPDVTFRLENPVEFISVPGGFGNAPSGSVEVTSIPSDESGLSDGLGALITVSAGQVVLLQFPEIEVGEQRVLIRISVRTSGGSVAPALAVADGAFDGSIATAIPARGSNFIDGYKRMVLLYDAPNDGSIVPLFQAAGLDVETTVYVDNVEIYLVPTEGTVPARLFNGE